LDMLYQICSQSEKDFVREKNQTLIKSLEKK